MDKDVLSTLNEVVRLMQDGQADAAERKCRDALARWEDDVNLVAMLGAILASKGETGQAENQLRLAIKLEPEFAKPYEDLGSLHLTRGDNDGAIQWFRKALALNPDQASAVRGLCVALERAGRADEARELRHKMRQSMSIGNLLREAEALRANGDIAASEQACDVILRREPRNTDALRILAKAATDDERFAVAEGYLKRIVSLLPNRADALFDLGKFLRDRGRYRDSITELRAAAHIAPDNPEIQSYLGNMLGIVGRTDEALQAYDNCLAQSADHPAALIGRGHMLRVAGRTDEARESYARCTRVHPGIGTAWWYLASLHGYVGSDEDTQLIQQQLDAGTTDRESEAGFRFALARTFEHLEQYGAAWQQYSLGNAAKRSLVNYDPDKIKHDNERIKQVFSHTFFAGTAADKPTDRTPIFILGMPRSGSTLIEQILSSHSQVEGCGELPAIITLTSALTSTLTEKNPGSLHYAEIVEQLNANELAGLGKSYLHNAATHCSDGCRYFTDKMPANFPHAGFIHSILPHAKIIDARRSPLATCVANYRQLFARGKHQSYDIGELGQYYLQYVDMMAHWDNVLPGKILRVHYEDIVADLEGQVRRLLDFCDLPFESTCVEFHKNRRAVNTASAEQVREPLYASGVEFWKHYDPYLDELRTVLAPVL
ncbi:MAG: sulfotransferase [Woeseia sp.]